MRPESPEGCLEEAQEPGRACPPPRLPPGAGPQDRALLGRREELEQGGGGGGDSRENRAELRASTSHGRFYD